MTLHLRLISDGDLSPVAGISHVSLNRWRTRGSLATQVIDGMPAGPELESHRDHAGTAVANLAEPRIIVPRPSLRLSAPPRRRKPSLRSPFQGV